MEDQSNNAYFEEAEAEWATEEEAAKMRAEQIAEYDIIACSDEGAS